MAKRVDEDGLEIAAGRRISPTKGGVNAADAGLKLVVVQPGRRISLEDRIQALSMSLPAQSAGRASPAAGRASPNAGRASPIIGYVGRASPVPNGVSRSAPTEDNDVEYSGIDSTAADYADREDGKVATGAGLDVRRRSSTADANSAPAHGPSQVDAALEKHITWSDEQGLALVEIFYSDRLHYSVPFDDGMHQSCCTIS